MHEWLQVPLEVGVHTPVAQEQSHTSNLKTGLRVFACLASFICKKKLNVFFENTQEIIEDSEPFVLDGLSDYKTREMLIEAYIHQHPERQSCQYLRESGAFPHGWVGEQVAIALSEDTQTFYAKLHCYLQNPEPLFEVKLKLDNLHIQGCHYLQFIKPACCVIPFQKTKSG